MRLDVALDVHAHEGGELHEARIDPAERAGDSGTARARSGSSRTIRSACDLASSFTLVGLTRVSIGPAISVMLRGCAGLPFCAITAAAASTATQGWQTATTCAPGPITSRNWIRWSTYSSKPKRPCSSGDVAHVVPVGDVDVVLGQHGPHGAAQQRREMAGQRRDQQHARLRGVDVLLEMQQRAERRDMRGLLAHRDLAVADRDLVDAERRPLVGEAGARDQFIGRGQIAHACRGRACRRRHARTSAPRMPASARTGAMMSEWA